MKPSFNEYMIDTKHFSYNHLMLASILTRVYLLYDFATKSKGLIFICF